MDEKELIRRLKEFQKELDNDNSEDDITLWDEYKEPPGVWFRKIERFNKLDDQPVAINETERRYLVLRDLYKDGLFRDRKEEKKKLKSKKKKSKKVKGDKNSMDQVFIH